MSADDDDVWHHYALDGGEALRAIEESLLALEQDPANAGEINRLYRGLHTLKGNSGFLRLSRIERLAHVSEDMIGLVRDGGVPLDPEMVDLLLGNVDRLREVVETAAREQRDAEEDRVADLVARVTAMMADRASGGRGAVHDASRHEESAAGSDEPPATETVDPGDDAGYVEIFLSIARQEAPELDAAIASGDLGAVSRIAEDLSLPAERMGYAAIVDVLDRLSAGSQGRADAGDLRDLALELFVALVRVEDRYKTLTTEPVEIGLAEIYGRAAAAAVSRSVSRLRALFERPGEMEDREVRTLFGRLSAAAAHFGLAEASRACCEQGDLLGRALASGAGLDRETIERSAELVARVSESLAGAESGAEAADIEPEEAPEDPMALAPDAVDLPLSEPLKKQLTSAAAEALSQLLGRSWSVFEIHADLERDPALADAFYGWLGASGVVLLTSAVVEGASGGGPLGYQFLAGARESIEDVRKSLAALDPGARRIRVRAFTDPMIETREPQEPVPQASLAARVTSTPSEPSDAGEPREASKADFLRIDGRKVSLIMDLAGEIGLASGAVTRHPDLDGKELEGFSAAAHKLEMLIRELQNEVSAMRLVPVAGVFNRMKRVVRDTARRTGKKVELVLVGEDTEIDKLMVDSLHDPLVHLMRNAIDHGIEPPEDRERAGKPATGRIVLEASHQGGEVSIAVSDDGRGLQRERILARAVDRGLVEAEARLSDEEIFELVFLPGFSTKEQIDALSGRGVGMDVIKTTIEGLRGRVQLRSTEGKGSRTTMTVPLTLAFVEAMVVRERDRLFALPIEKVFEVFKAERDQISQNSADGETMLRIRDRLVPVLWLHRYYGEAGEIDEHLESRVVVVVQTSRGDLALPVDKLLGNQQVMLKPMRGVLAGVRAAAGCGMLRSGDVALALDCERLHA
jgi:two-component system, chemotaxis family, sensor kinase CheA